MVPDSQEAVLDPIVIAVKRLPGSSTKGVKHVVQFPRLATVCIVGIVQIIIDLAGKGPEGETISAAFNQPARKAILMHVQHHQQPQLPKVLLQYHQHAQHHQDPHYVQHHEQSSSPRYCLIITSMLNM